MPSARVFGPWPEHSNPAASCLQWSCALQAEAVDTFFFFACAHLTRGRCCTSDLIAPLLIAGSCSSKPKRNRLTHPICTTAVWITKEDGNSKSIVAFGTFEKLEAVDPVSAVQNKSRPDSLQTVFALCFPGKTLRNRPEAQGLPSHEKFVIHNESAHTQFSRTLNLNPSFAIFND